MRDSRFTDKQVVSILRRAAELQSDSGFEPDALTGSTEQDLLQIGGELGLGPQFIQAAIEEENLGPEKEGFNWTGGSVVIETERVYSGSLSDDGWQELLAHFRKSFGRIGKSSEVGSSREWTGGEKELDPIQVTVLSKNGQIRVSASSNVGPTLVLLGISFFIPALLTVISTLDSAGLGDGIKISIILGSLALLGLACRTWFGWIAKRRQKAISSLFLQIGKSFERNELSIEQSAQAQSDDIPLDLKLQNGRS